MTENTAAHRQDLCMYVSGQHDRMLHKLPNTKLYKTLKQLKIDTEINLI